MCVGSIRPLKVVVGGEGRKQVLIIFDVIQSVQVGEAEVVCRIWFITESHFVCSDKSRWILVVGNASGLQFHIDSPILVRPVHYIILPRLR